MTIISFISPCQIVRNILNKNTQLPVPFASVKVLNKPRGVIASSEGEFSLLIEKSDTIVITSVGYYQLIVTGEKIENTIYLVPKILSLPGVLLEKRKYFRTIIVGYTQEITKNSLSWGPGPESKGEIAQKIDLPDSTFFYKIKKIFIPVQKFRCWGPLLLRFFRMDSTSEYPGEEIFSKYVSLRSKDIKKQKALIDVSSDSIYLHNERYFFVSVAWPEDVYQDNCITTIQLSSSSKENSYSRYLASNNYNWFLFEIHPKTESGPAKTIFSVEVDEFK